MTTKTNFIIHNIINRIYNILTFTNKIMIDDMIINSKRDSNNINQTIDTINSMTDNTTTKDHNTKINMIDHEIINQILTMSSNETMIIIDITMVDKTISNHIIIRTLQTLNIIDHMMIGASIIILNNPINIVITMINNTKTIDDTMKDNMKTDNTMIDNTMIDNIMMLQLIINKITIINTMKTIDKEQRDSTKKKIINTESNKSIMIIDKIIIMTNNTIHKDSKMKDKDMMIKIDIMIDIIMIQTDIDDAPNLKVDMRMIIDRERMHNMINHNINN